jgi:hypothetical protein
VSADIGQRAFSTGSTSTQNALFKHRIQNAGALKLYIHDDVLRRWNVNVMITESNIITSVGAGVGAGDAGAGALDVFVSELLLLVLVAFCKGNAGI